MENKPNHFAPHVLNYWVAILNWLVTWKDRYLVLEVLVVYKAFGYAVFGFWTHIYRDTALDGGWYVKPW